MKLEQQELKNKTPEAEANFEGNQTEVMLSRVNNPVIFGQIFNLLYKSSLARVEWLKANKDKLKQFTQSGLIFFKDEEGTIITEESFQDSDPEEIKKEIIEQIHKVSISTPISFSKKQPTAERMNLNWIYPYTGEKLSSVQKNITSAHEKGHKIRPYTGNYLNNYFKKGFDVSKVIYSSKDVAIFREQIALSGGPKTMTDAKMKNEGLKYLFSAMEIAERMSQLKNYFGMKDTEIFTKEHLEYARKNYVKDTGMDNQMTQFFQAITPETENNFIELINSSGI